MNRPSRDRPLFTDKETNYLIHLVAMVTNMITLAVTALFGVWAGFSIVAGCVIVFVISAYRLRMAWRGR